MTNNYSILVFLVTAASADRLTAALAEADLAPCPAFTSLSDKKNTFVGRSSNISAPYSAFLSSRELDHQRLDRLVYELIVRIGVPHLGYVLRNLLDGTGTIWAGSAGIHDAVVEKAREKRGKKDGKVVKLFPLDGDPEGIIDDLPPKERV